jgi:hypothetical protein
MIADESFGTTDQAYHLTRVHHVGEHTLRVRIHRDAYDFQSHAIAEVLTPAMTWTQLAAEPPSVWHEATPSLYAAKAKVRPEALHPLAERLLQRATTILRA